MINVLHIRSSFDPGGTETLLLSLYNHEQNEIRFHYILLKDGEYVKYLNSEQNEYTVKRRQGKFDPGLLLFLQRYIAKNEIQIIHTHQVIEFVYALALRLLQLGRLEIVHHIHLYNSRNNWKYYFERYFSRYSKWTLTVSESLKTLLIKRNYPEKKIRVLHNAVNTKSSISLLDTDIDDLRAAISYTKHDFIIGMIGNFVSEKDQQTIIEAFNSIRDSYNQLKLVFIGNHEINDSFCKQYVQDNDPTSRIYFMGALPNARKYLNLFSLITFSSKMETFGISVIEAILENVPVAASDIPVMRELSGQGSYFELFPPGDSLFLAKLIKQHIASKKVDLTASKIHFEKEYSFQKYISQLKDIYS